MRNRETLCAEPSLDGSAPLRTDRSRARAVDGSVADPGSSGAAVESEGKVANPFSPCISHLQAARVTLARQCINPLRDLFEALSNSDKRAPGNCLQKCLLQLSDTGLLLVQSAPIGEELECSHGDAQASFRP